MLAPCALHLDLESLGDIMPVVSTCLTYFLQEELELLQLAKPLVMVLTIRSREVGSSVSGLILLGAIMIVMMKGVGQVSFTRDL